MSTENQPDDHSDEQQEMSGEVQLANPPLQEILVPMDSTGIGQYGLEHIMPIVQCCGATIHALYVRKSPGAYKRDRLRFDPDEQLEQLGTEFHQEMEQKGLDVTRTIRTGMPVSEIMGYVEEHDIDLILMTTHGRTGMNRILRGSVTEEIIRKSSVPVMAIKYEE